MLKAIILTELYCFYKLNPYVICMIFRITLLIGIVLFSTASWGNSPKNNEQAQAEPISKLTYFDQQRRLFQKADKNNDSQVSYEETILFFDEMNRPKYEKKFRDLDKDHNGLLSEKEILNWHRNYQEKRAENRFPYNQNWFNKLDKDEDGLITKDDAIIADNEKKKPKWSAEDRATKDLQSKDLDHSGSVTLNEYLKSKSPNSSKANAQLIYMRDKNGDSFIAFHENEKFMKDIFKALDKNDDDLLSAEEQKQYGFKATQSINVGQRGIIFLKGLPPGMRFNP